MKLASVEDTAGKQAEGEAEVGAVAEVGQEIVKDLDAHQVVEGIVAA